MIDASLGASWSLRGSSQIRRKAIFTFRFLAALPLLLLGAQRAPDCERASSSIPPGPLLAQTAIETGRPIRVEEGAVLAEEAFRYADAAWRTPEVIRLQAPDAVVFPAGTPVRTRRLRTYSGPGEYRPCLPEFQVRSAGSRMSARVVACMVDSDGDGRTDLIERWSYMPGMQAIIFGGEDAFPLPRPLRLEDDPAGAPASCRHAQRRLKFSRVEEDSIWIDDLAVEQGCGVDEPLALDFAEQSDGSRVYMLPPPAPPLETRAPGSLTRTFVANRERVDLVDGASVTVGGLRLRLGRTDEGWTATPLDAAFSPWLPPRCE